MRLANKFLPLLLALLVVSIAAVWATDTSTWKPFDLFVKRNLYVAGHILSGKPSDGSANSFYTLPTIAAGAGAGTSPTLTITGNDMAGQISVTTGSSPSTSSVIATVTYGSAYKTNSFVILEPANANAAALAVGARPYAAGTTTTMVVNSGATALTGATTYLWNYVSFGN